MNFSVLLSLYRGERPDFLALALKSIWDDQSVRPGEIVLVIDGPVGSELFRVVEKWKNRLQEALVLIQLKENVGLGAALNAGLSQCRFELVARMDTDDIALPVRFEKQLAVFSLSKDVDIVGSAVTEIDSWGNFGDKRSVPCAHNAIIDSLWACPLIHPSVMFRRSKILVVGGYDAKLRRRQDYELWFRCAKGGLVFSNLDMPLLLYRFDAGTHKKQPTALAWHQGLIGYKGARLIGLARWKAYACFIPFFRSLLPAKVQHYLYRYMRLFDPRHKNEKSA